MGTVVGMPLLVPAVGAHLLESWAQKRQSAAFSGRAVPYVPAPRAPGDLPLLVFCSVVALLQVGLVSVAILCATVTAKICQLGIGAVVDQFTQGWRRR